MIKQMDYIDLLKAGIPDAVAQVLSDGGADVFLNADGSIDISDIYGIEHFDSVKKFRRAMNYQFRTWTLEERSA